MLTQAMLIKLKTEKNNHVYKKNASEIFSLPELALLFPSAVISADCQVHYDNHSTLHQF